jgi:hypothetical protein
VNIKLADHASINGLRFLAPFNPPTSSPGPYLLTKDLLMHCVHANIGCMFSQLGLNKTKLRNSFANDTLTIVYSANHVNYR